MFTGAEGIKTPEQAGAVRRHRRRGVRPLLPPGLRHLANINLKAWGEMKDAAADVLYQLALTKNQILNGSTPKKSTKKSQKVAKIARAPGAARSSAAAPSAARPPAARPRIRKRCPGVGRGTDFGPTGNPNDWGHPEAVSRSHPRRGGGSRRAARRHARVRPQPRLSGGKFLPWRPSEERDPEESVLELLLELLDRGLCRCECFSRYAPEGELGSGGVDRSASAPS